MKRQLDAATLRLLLYEAKALYDMRRYLASSHQTPTQPSLQENPPRTPSCAAFCASTPSPDSFASYNQFSTEPLLTPTDPVVKQALLEAFLVHYRILAEFLCKHRTPRTPKDQILAEDFANISDYPSINAKRDLCDKWLAHLSSHRNPDNKPAWDPPDMYHNITLSLRDFLKPLAVQFDDAAKRYYAEILQCTCIFDA